MWKRWRKEAADKKTATEDSHKTNQEKWLDKLDETLERLRKEVEDKKRAQAMYEERRNKLLADQKIKQEQMLRKEQERRERKQTKRMLEERWAMARWIVGYIDENTDRWKMEQKVRLENKQQTAEEWKKMERFEKIRLIKEKQEENSTVHILIRTAKLNQMPRKVQAKHQPSQGAQSEKTSKSE